MKIRTLVAASLVAAVTLVGGPTVAAPSVEVSSSTPTAVKMRPCTKTSSGTCIRGGQFCPQAKYGTSGWDARGKRWVCKGDKTHPHWLKP